MPPLFPQQRASQMMTPFTDFLSKYETMHGYTTASWAPNRQLIQAETCKVKVTMHQDSIISGDQCRTSVRTVWMKRAVLKGRLMQLRTQTSCDRAWGSLVQNNAYTHQNFCQIFGPHLGKKTKRWFRPFHVLSALVDWQVHRNPKVLGRVSQHPGRSPTPLCPDQKPQNLIIILITGTVVLCLKQA